MASSATTTRPRPGDGQASWSARTRLTLHVLARAYRAFLLTLLAVALLPSLWSWSGYVVRTGSMEPTISVGDVVVAKPFSAEQEVPLGRVVVFPNQSKPASEELLVHRVVERLVDGSYATAGDANGGYDAAPVTAVDLEAQAVVLVPLVGRPLVWVNEGRLLPLGLWASFTVGALVLAARRHGPGAGRGGAGPVSAARPGSRRSRWPRRAAALGPVVALVAGVGTHAHVTDPASAAFSDHTGSGSNTWTVAEAAPQPYTDRVLADQPYAYYQLDEQTGATMADGSGNTRDGAIVGVEDYRRPGALPTNAGFSVRLDGGNARLVTGGSAIEDPGTFSLELWFRTRTTSGGKLIGFESTRNVRSPSFDRHVLMRRDGRLTYGDWPALGGTRTVVSPQAYNNGGWHHLVLTARPQGPRQAVTMYVDGRQVAAGTTSRTGGYDGWWRVGDGSLVVGDPANASLDADVDQLAIYPAELGASRVESHWNAR